MWDLGDTLSSGKLLGFKDPWRFAFEQATLHWSSERILPWQKPSLQRTRVFLEHEGRLASWQDGRLHRLRRPARGVSCFHGDGRAVVE